MAQDAKQDGSSTPRIVRGVYLNARTFRAGDESDLAAALDASQVERLTQRGAIAGAWTAGRKAEKAAKAEPAEPAPAEPVADSLPDDFPARDLLAESGFASLAAVRDASDDDLLAVDGIGAKRLEQIRAAQG